MATPSLYQVIFGIGTPRAEQFTRTGASNSWSVTMLKGTFVTSTGSGKEFKGPISICHRRLGEGGGAERFFQGKQSGGGGGVSPRHIEY